METLARTNAAARQRLSDMGTEFGVVDASEVAHECAHRWQSLDIIVGVASLFFTLIGADLSYHIKLSFILSA